MMDFLGFILGAVYGLIHCAVMLLLGIIGIFLVFLGPIMLIVAPPAGAMMIVIGGLCIARLGKKEEWEK